MEAIKHIRQSLRCVYARNNAATALQQIFSTLIQANPGNVTLALEWSEILGEVGQHETASGQILQAALVLANKQPTEKVPGYCSMLDFL